jgi:trehalose/maltose transport system permease protein
MRKALVYLLVVVLIGWTVFPFYWAIVTSFKSGSDLFKVQLIPTLSSGLSNYKAIFLEQPFGENIFNSIFVSLLTVLIATVIALFASFALGRRTFPGRRAILLCFLFVSMFPQIAVLSGLFEMIRALGLFNRKPALILSYLIFTLPFTVWTLTVFMRELPKGLEEAALVDGAGPLTIIFKIFLPVLAPALVTTTLLGFIAAWNEFLFALTFSLTDRSRTVPVAIALMSGASEHEIPWGRIMAASVLVTLPVIFLVWIFQKRIVSGLTAGAVKG